MNDEKFEMTTSCNSSGLNAFHQYACHFLLDNCRLSFHILRSFWNYTC